MAAETSILGIAKRSEVTCKLRLRGCRVPRHLLPRPRAGCVLSASVDFFTGQAACQVVFGEDDRSVETAGRALEVQPEPAALQQLQAGLVHVTATARWILDVHLDRAEGACP